MFEVERQIMLASLKEARAYRFSMMFSLVSGPLVVLTNYFIWKTVFAASENGLVGSYTFEQMIAHLVMGIVTFYLLWDNVHETLEKAIETGSLVAFMLKPINFMKYEFFTKLGHRLLAFCIEFVPVFTACGLLVGFDVFRGGHWVLYFGAVLIGTTVYFLVSMLIGMSAFWLSKARGVRKLYHAIAWILTGGALPLSLYPPVVQKVFLFLPFQFLGFVPARVFLGEYSLGGITLNPYQTLLFGAVYAILMWIAVSILWKISVKKFCGAGA